MMPQLATIARSFDVPVFSAGGFESVTLKKDAADRFAREGRRTVVLHVGDHDPSGVAIFTSLREDIAAICADLGEDDCVSFVRIAITPAQIEKYGLPEAPAKATDRRGEWTGGTVQAEALAPDQLADIVRAAIETYTNSDILAAVREQETQERGELITFIERALAAEGGSE